MIWQLTYIHKVVVISLFIEKKNTRRGSTVFLSQNYIPNSNLKQWYFYHAQKIHNGLKRETNILGGKPLLHGINLRKSPVINHNTFIFGWIII